MHVNKCTRRARVNSNYEVMTFFLPAFQGAGMTDKLGLIIMIIFTTCSLNMRLNCSSILITRVVVVPRAIPILILLLTLLSFYDTYLAAIYYRCRSSSDFPTP